MYYKQCVCRVGGLNHFWQKARQKPTARPSLVAQNARRILAFGSIKVRLTKPDIILSGYAEA